MDDMTSGSPIYGDERRVPLSPHAIALEALVARRGELTLRDVLARTIATLIATGRHDPAKHTSPDHPHAQPLTAAEHLELLAVEESIRRHLGTRGLTIHGARLAGARWDDIARAGDVDVDAARADLYEWIVGQERLWDTWPSESGRPVGLGPAARAAARALLADD